MFFNRCKNKQSHVQKILSIKIKKSKLEIQAWIYISIVTLKINYAIKVLEITMR